MTKKNMTKYIVTVDENGTRWWYNENNLRHRTDGPAIEYADGSKFWYLHDKCHRVDGPAVERADGTKHWYLNNQLHRTDGPAIEYASGTKHWYLNGKLHRANGPAVEYADGTKLWYLNDVKLTESEFLAKTKKASCEGKMVEIDGVKYEE